MADFKTHLIGAAAVSGITATALMLADVLPQGQIINCFILGTIGGLLPDIDSESSVPFRVAFNILGVLAGFLAVLNLGKQYSLAELIVVWILAFAAIRVGVCMLVSRYTVHRGLVHSIPAALAFGLGVVLIASYLLGKTPVFAWMAGSFVTLGFLVHLLLDECYSVNLMGVSLKRSFGTAFNLGSFNQPLGTLLLYLLVVVLYLNAPPPTALLERLAQGRYTALADRLLPQGAWFAGLLPPL